MKNLLVILAIIVVFIVGYNLVSKNRRGSENQPTPTTSTTTNESVTTEKEEQSAVTQDKLTVTYGDNGFGPKSLNVPVGAAVTFTNNSDSSMWVASDPHPVHSNLPEFNQKQSVEKGENYSFTFTKKGRWDYHNHRSPGNIGNIIVE